MTKAKPLIIRDEIHGDMSFDGLLRQVIDHPYFQRLRHIKQLGLAEYVFPCATHTRFQHSLGASYLAGQYFRRMVEGWLNSPFEFEGKCEGTVFYAKQTIACLRAVAGDASSLQFWLDAVSLSGLLHDVGHGPWSHTFEYLDLEQDFRAITKKMKGAVGKYFSDLESAGRRLHHEDLSVIYIFSILEQIPNASHFFLPVAMLVNRKMTSGKFQAVFEKELAEILKKNKILGGVEIHKLLRPIISGPFDVDRIDYIQRDGRNCGVNIGGIEWRRIVTKLIPCLADHSSKQGEPKEVILISNIRNQHVLDDFIFSLFQMYAQVYMHPKIVGVEELTKRLLQKNRKKVKNKPIITFELHQSLTDEKFRTMLIEDFAVPEVDEILIRKKNHTFQVATSPNDPEMEKDLLRNGFSLIDVQDRPMMKDSVGVFLFSAFRGDSSGKKFFLRSWTKVSPIAHQYFDIKYAPRIWLRAGLEA